ncbi:probable hexosyltransferase MUCI70 [Magnolia sinica]|uniref:probable hexosyltransferase MUCI70 n=1 Tax=Magnolia sinica TaxID=86752 RepID=UPI00265A5259|nr:probable hexosyltransferase MUCI70 [Magnolia sinica]
MFSISVSDEDSDDLSGKARSRHRKKRRKPGLQGKKDTIRWIFRTILRWWPVLIFVPAIIFLLFQAPNIGHDQNDELKPNPVEDTPVGNLNQLGVRYRVVNGVREPCLKILPPNEIQRLEFPADVEPDFPVKRVVYKSASEDTSHIGGDGLLLRQYTKATRFNLFTGNQTLEERAESFKVSETAVVNCGFYSENGGFKISDEDKAYMQSCKAVVSTCAFGGGDDLYQPIGMMEASLRKVCYVAFWDEITRSTHEAEGKRIGEDSMIGKWRIVVVKDLPFTDQRLNGKIPKMLSHRLFPQAKYSIWVDSKSQFRRDPLGVLEALLWRTNSVLAISEHGARSSVYDEGKAIVKKNKATPEEVEVQLTQYRHDGFPDDKRFKGKKALSEASVIVREHTPLSNLFMCLWFNEVVRFTSRDQLSFPYVLRRLNVLKINMFPVCTRKDLVNSMGHKRKVKPLII